jgi:sterol desaturase/sphingolipid hydroxylase (fatty acid hydroxylase superfamily)
MSSAVASLLAKLAVCGLALGVLAMLFVPLERLFQARPHAARHQRVTDLAFFVWQHLVWTGAVVASLHSLTRWLSPACPLVHVRALHTLPAWQQSLLALMAGDVLLYWGHRLQHRVDFLWRFHRVHHSATQLDWLLAFREHPLDGLYTRALLNLPAILLGLQLEAIAGVLAFRGLWAIFIHANVALSPGPLRYLLGSPQLHTWHHAFDSRPGHNFANLLPLLDVLFGTYHLPEQAPQRLGAPGPVAESYLAHLFQPFRRRPRSAPEKPTTPGA